MKHISLNESYISNFVSKAEIDSVRPDALAARKTLLEGTGKGADFRGWIDLPVNYDKKEFARIKAAARKIRSDSKALVVIGIGGSYLGARAACEFVKPGYGYGGGTATEIYYVGNNLSTSYLNCVCGLIGDRDFSVNVISKSGTTTEPAVAFRIFKHALERKYGKEEAAKRIYVTTDKERGALKGMADKNGYETFVIPDDIGGRFSVLTAVGLLPICVAGINIDHLMKGAADAREELISANFKDNMALRYAAIRNRLYHKRKTVEILANYDPSFSYIAEWWKQLYGESEGKHHKGIFPASVNFTTDLHSLGQFIQDGPRMMFETILRIEDKSANFKILHAKDDSDGLNYLAGKTLKDINECAMLGTIKAHVDGGVPNLIINVDGRTAEALGELFYFFEFACGVSGYMLGVNPFDQPGVEAYKKNMFMLLGKPGYEK